MAKTGGVMKRVTAKRKNSYDLLVVTYYTRYEDESDEDCINGDYSWMEIRDSNDALLTDYGDYYHDKGLEKVEGFIDGFTILFGKKPKVEYKNVVSSEYSPSGDEKTLLSQLK